MLFHHHLLWFQSQSSPVVMFKANGDGSSQWNHNLNGIEWNSYLLLLLLSVVSIMSSVISSEANNVVVLSSPRKGYPLNRKFAQTTKQNNLFVCVCLATAQVWLSISSKPHRRLVLNWHRLDTLVLNNSWVALYDHEPTRHNFDISYIERVKPYSPSGKHL